MTDKCPNCGGKLEQKKEGNILICTSCGKEEKLQMESNKDEETLIIPFLIEEEKLKNTGYGRMKLEKVYEVFLYINGEGSLIYQDGKNLKKKYFRNEIMVPLSKYMVGSEFFRVSELNIWNAVPYNKSILNQTRKNAIFAEQKYIERASDYILGKIEGTTLIGKEYFSSKEKQVYVPIYYLKDDEENIIYVVNGETGQIIIENWIDYEKKSFQETIIVVIVFILFALIFLNID